MPIAVFGNKVFQVSSKKVYTFNELSHSMSLETESQEREGLKPTTYVKGEALDQLSFTVALDCRFVNIEADIEDWKMYLKLKQPRYFSIGGKLVSSNRFLLKSISVQDTVLNNSGKYLKAKLNLTFEEYVATGSKEAKEAAKEASKAKTKKTKEDKQPVNVFSEIMDTTKKRNNTNATSAVNAGTKK